jgi:hypothetical protein
MNVSSGLSSTCPPLRGRPGRGGAHAVSATRIPHAGDIHPSSRRGAPPSIGGFTTSPSPHPRPRSSTNAPSGAQGEGWTLESGPREYACSPGCYAVFPYDPDGIKLEIVHTPA